MASADGNATPAKDAMEQSPSLCAKGCGFFGNASTAGMCSKCYKETVAKSAAAAPAAVAPMAASPAAEAKAPPTPPAETAPPAEAFAAASSSVAPAAPPAEAAAAEAAAAEPAPALAGATRPPETGNADEEEPPKKVQVNTNRCWSCNKKIGLLGFQCKCEYYFCSEHRYSDKHECLFDYKGLAKQQLTKANPTIAPSKLERA